MQKPNTRGHDRKKKRKPQTNNFEPQKNTIKPFWKLLRSISGRFGEFGSLDSSRLAVIESSRGMEVADAARAAEDAQENRTRCSELHKVIEYMEEERSRLLGIGAPEESQETIFQIMLALEDEISEIESELREGRQELRQVTVEWQGYGSPKDRGRWMQPGVTSFDWRCVEPRTLRQKSVFLAFPGLTSSVRARWEKQ